MDKEIACVFQKKWQEDLPDDEQDHNYDDANQQTFTLSEIFDGDCFK